VASLALLHATGVHAALPARPGAHPGHAGTAEPALTSPDDRARACGRPAAALAKVAATGPRSLGGPVSRQPRTAPLVRPLTSCRSATA
jgi:hypothetical protein